MKTKFKDEFDKFDIDFDIDEITVVKDLGIDPETIKCKAMQQIRASKTKRNRKRLSIWLVAAAVSAAVVGTTVIATTGLLHPDFTPIYTGDVSVLEVVGTNEFNFSSDNNSLNAEFLGMVFTEKNLVASVALTKTDGTAFTDADGIIAPDAEPLNNYISLDNCPDDSDSDYYLSRLRDAQKTADYPYVYFMQGKNNELYESGSDDLYYVLSEDGMSLKIYITTPLLTDKEDEGLVTLKSEYLYQFSYDEQLCAFNTMNEDIYLEAETICSDKNLDIENDCRWRIEKGRYCLYSIKKEKLPLSFEMKYQAEYMEPEIISSVLDNNNSPMMIKPGRTADLMISPTQISITSNEIFTPEQIREMQKTGYYTEDQLYSDKNSILNYEDRISAFVLPPRSINNISSIDYEHSMVILTDSSVKYLLAEHSGIEWNTDEETGSVMINDELRLLYSDVFIDSDLYTDITADKILGIGKTTVTDPKKIAKIVINNETIYTKQGFEDIKVPDRPGNTDITTRPGIDLSIPEKGNPDMNNYHPYQNNINQINLFLRYLDIYYCTSRSITPYVNVDDNPNYISTDISLEYEGSEEELKDILYYLIGLEEKNIFITSVTFSKPNEEKTISMKVELINPYPTRESGLTENDSSKYILMRWNSVDRKALTDRYFDTHTDVEASEFTIFLDKNKAVPEIPEPVTPITIPGHKPVYQVSIKDFKYKKWTKEQLSEQVCSIADNIDVFDLESIKDIDNSSFSASQIVFHFKGSKEDIISLLKSISAMEKDNIFIKSLNVMYIDEIEYVSYELDITIVNPYYMESSDITEETAADYILSHYGSTDWISATAAGIDLYKDINNVTDTSMYIQQNEETGLPDFIVSIHERFDNMEDIKEYRNSFEKNDTFALGDEFNYEKVINTEDESKILYDTITTLRSDKFLK